MVIPGVSGSMVLMLIGYYEPVINALDTLKNGQLSALGILLPFAVGVVVGIFAISKLIDMLLKNYPDKTFCAILGLVIASPVALIMQNADCFSIANAWNYLACAVCLGAGFAAAYLLSGKGKKA
jgi:putative membrane protein